MREKLTTTVGLVGMMLVLLVADIVVLEGFPGLAVVADQTDTGNPVLEFSDTSANEPLTPPPPGGVRKYDGPDVMAILVSNGLTTSENRDKMVLTRVIPESEQVYVYALLKDGDRAGAMAWVHSPNVKRHWLVLKEALHTAFTAEVQDLLDETQRREGHPTRNLLTFFDPGLFPERVVFIRVQERLYEFHVAEGQSEKIFNVIEELTE